MVVWPLLEPHFNLPLRFGLYSNSKTIQAFVSQSYAIPGSSILALLAISEQALMIGVWVRSGERGIGGTQKQEWTACVCPEWPRGRGAPVRSHMRFGFEKVEKGI